MALRLVILFICFSLNVTAQWISPKTVWYVRPITAEYGLENGTSFENAFDGFAGINWGSVQAGHTLLCIGYFSNEVLTVESSGSAENPIKIKGVNCIINGAATQISCININNYNYITVENFYLLNATTNGLLVQGASTGIVAINIIAEKSGNQNYQHLNTASVTYYNCQGNYGVDDGISMHDACIVYGYNCSYYGNAQNVNIIQSSKATLNNCIISNGTDYNYYTTNGTTDSSCYLTLNYCLIQNGRNLCTVRSKTKLNYCKVLGNVADHVCDNGSVSATNYGFFEANYSVFSQVNTTKYLILTRESSAAEKSTAILRNCTIFDEDKAGNGIFCDGTCVTYNCIFTNLITGYNEIAGGSATSNTDCYYGNTTAYTAGVTANTPVTGNPNLYSVANGQAWVTAGSSCINTGLNLGTTYQMGLKNNSIWTYNINLLNQNSYGAGWEIGAYVYEP